MIVNVVPDADLPYALIEGIRSDRALGILLRAVRSWYAFGHYDHVIIDLTSFDDWSSSIVDQLASAVTMAGDAGHWLAFFPGHKRWMRGADLDQIHVYPDRARALLAMQENSLSRQERRWRWTREQPRRSRRCWIGLIARGSVSGR
jgi:hypothetical protein